VDVEHVIAASPWSTLAGWRSIGSGELVSDAGRPAAGKPGVTKPGVTRYW